MRICTSFSQSYGEWICLKRRLLSVRSDVSSTFGENRFRNYSFPVRLTVISADSIVSELSRFNLNLLEEDSIIAKD